MIKAIIRSLLIFLLLFTAVITFLLTPTGLQVATHLASRLLPGQLSIKKISGILVGPITVDDLHYQDQNQTIAIKKLRFDWHPLGLLNNQLHITSLDIHDFYLVTSRNALPEKWSITTLKKTWATMLATLKKRPLPFHVTIDTAFIDHIDVLDPSTQIHIYANTMRFHIIFSQHIWNAALLASITKPQPLQLQIHIRGIPSDYHGQLSLIGKQTHLEFDGTGSRQSLLVHTVKNYFLDGNLTLQMQLRWNKLIHWQGKITAEKINAKLISAQFSPSISFDIDGNGTTNIHWDIDNDFTTHVIATIALPSTSIHVLANRTNTWNISWQTTTHSLSNFEPNLHGNITTQGKVSGDLNNPTISADIQGQFQTALAKINHFDAKIMGDLKQHTLNATIDMPDTKLHLAMNGSWDQQTQQWHGLLQSLLIQGDQTKNWQLQKKVMLTADHERLSISPICLENKIAGTVCAQGQFTDKKISADVKASIPHFIWLESAIKHVRIPVGSLMADFHISGTPQKPSISGSAKLTEGNVVLPHLNIILTHTSVNMIGKGRLLTVSAQAFSQTQPIQLTGAIDLSQLTAPLKFTLTSHHALITNTEEYKMYATANLTGTLQNKITTLTGSISIPEALIEPNDYQTTITLPEHDMVYIKNTPKTSDWELNSNFKLELGNDVRFKAFGINALFGGSVQLLQDPRKALFATGNLFITQGTYSVYGQTLNIESGSNLSYDNNLISNPTFTMRAYKTIKSNSIMAGGVPAFSEEDLIAGLEIHGTIKAYRISFYSNRSRLSQADILSYILLGYRTAPYTPGNTDLMLRALSAVKISSQGLMGKQNIAAQIQQGLGLNEMGVESETTTDELGNPLNQQSAFVVGKSLTPHLFVRYSIGLLDPVNLVQVRYIFKKHWGIQGDSSSLGNGGDILYTLSKD